MEYKCPETGCNKSFARKTLLNRHLQRVHDKGGGNGGNVGNAGDGGKKFKVKVAKPKPEDTTTYRCGACQAALDGEVSPCPQCGADLTWS